jgi:hypothetical protein
LIDRERQVLQPLKDAHASTPRRRINCRRFSLRTLLIAFTLQAICCAIWAEGARRQRKTVADLRELGVGLQLFYDFEVTRKSNGDYKHNGSTATSNVPSWLLNGLGLDYFHSPVVVYLYIPRPIDALPLLKKLPRLSEVHFPWRGQPDDKADIDRLKSELPAVNVIIKLAIVG